MLNRHIFCSEFVYTAFSSEITSFSILEDIYLFADVKMINLNDRKTFF